MKLKIILSLSLLINVLTCFSQAPTWAWCKSDVGSSLSGGENIITDASGNSYVTGEFMGNTSFGTFSLTNTSGTYWDIFVVKYNSAGTVVWAKSFGGTDGPSKGTVITLDAAGNIVFGGFYYTTSLTIGTSTLNSVFGDQNIFFAKLDPSGNVLLAKSLKGKTNTGPHCLRTDANSNIYFTGMFIDTLTISTSTLICSNGIPDGFLAKYDSNGNPIWGRSLAGGTQEELRGLGFDNTNNVYVSGITGYPINTIGNYTLSSGGIYGPGIIIAKLDPSGNTTWAKYVTKKNSYCGKENLAFDNSNNFYVCGNYNDTLTVGTFSVISKNFSNDNFLVKYDNNGNALFLKSYGGNDNEQADAVKCDNFGSVYISGYFDSGTSLALGNYTVSNASGRDLYVGKIDATGNVTWATSTGGDSYDYCKSFSTDAMGNTYLTGFITSTTGVAFGTTTITSNNGSNKFYAAKLNSAGVGINEKNPDNHFVNVFPNPSKNKFTVALSSDVKEIQILNYAGQIIEIEKIIPQNESVEIEIKESGIYFVRIISEREVISKKVIIAN